MLALLYEYKILDIFYIIRIFMHAEKAQLFLLKISAEIMQIKVENQTHI